MIITSIELHNWQPYYGFGQKGKTRVNFKGKSGKKNIIFYGQNTNGKTAFWEAIQFSFFGRVNKRRSSGIRDGNFKPLVADSTDFEPLLNVSAWDEGNCNFGVVLEFNHEGDDFRLERFYQPRTGVRLARRDSEMELHLTLRNLSKNKYIKNEQTFLNNILPEKLSRFFMFDGERAKEYRDLFMDAGHDVELRGLIEDILRFPILTQGAGDFRDISKECSKEITKYVKTASKDATLIKHLEKLEGIIEQNTTFRDQFKNKLDEKSERLSQLNNWLKNNDKGKEALVQEEMYSKLVEDLEDAIKTSKERMARFLPESWRAILRTRINDRIAQVEEDLKRQEKEKEEIEGLKFEIGNLETRLRGKPCKHCGHKQDEPSSDEIDSISRTILEKEQKIQILEESRISPSPLVLLKRQDSLKNMSSDRYLDVVVDYETDILTNQKKLRDAKNNLKDAVNLLTADAKKEVQAHILEKEQLLEKIGDLKGELKGVQDFLSQIEGEHRLKSKGLQSSTGSKTKVHEKAELKQNIADAFEEIWTNQVEVHREAMRSRVESHASKVFMKLTNKEKVYSGLKITKNFQIALLNKKGRGDSGSQGQWALIAYSILDALTTCSGTEFPLVIDTPGASIDDEHLEKLFEYLLSAGKQVMIFAEGTELKPEKGDSDFAHHCAATYKLKMKAGENEKSEILISYNNLEE